MYFCCLCMRRRLKRLKRMPLLEEFLRCSPKMRQPISISISRSTIKYQLSTININYHHQLSISTININYQYQLSIINYQLSTININYQYQLSTINYQLSTININYQLSISTKYQQCCSQIKMWWWLIYNNEE